MTTCFSISHFHLLCIKNNIIKSNQTFFFFNNSLIPPPRKKKMILASSSSSTVFTVSPSSSATKTRRYIPKTPQSPFLFKRNCNPTSLQFPPSTRSTKLCSVQATVLKENEDEKVVAEESFRPSTFTHGPEASPQPSPPTELDKWVVKLEQSVNVFLTDSVVTILDALYHDRDYARFYVLETIARVPYFAFISVLHLYESFGWWRRSDYIKVHFAESWNEMHHLLIMEDLGGNSWWPDRFLAQHMAFFYYIMTVLMYALSPRMAYHFSECVENHAFETYDKFIKARGEDLKKMPAPEVAVKYYTEGDLFLFDEFQTSRAPNSRRPKIENLYDVFLNIRDDEAEHCKTMGACQTHGNLRSPHSYPEDASGDDFGSEFRQADCEGVADCLDKSVTSPSSKQKQNI